MPTIHIFVILSLLVSFFGLIKKKPYSDHLQPFLDQQQVDYNRNRIGFPAEAQEQTTPIELAVIGKIPSWLEGQLIQNGPGKFTIGNQKLTHWFDGFALLSSFKFNQGKIDYQSAFLKSDPLEESLRTNNIKLLSFAQLVSKPQTYHRSRDGQKVQSTNANINIQRLGKHFIALGETPLPIEFVPANLKTIGFFDFTDQLKKVNGWESAHMQQDPSDGTVYNFYIDYGRKSAYMLYKLEAKNGQTTRTLLKRETVAEPSYMHDFSITQHYIILTAYPLVVNARDLNDSRYSFIGAHRWEPERKTKVYVFDKRTGKRCALLDTVPMFAFHHVNAFEDKKGLIHIYLTTTKNVDIIAQINDFEKIVPQEFQELVIDLPKASVEINTLSKDIYELPTVNPKFKSRENQYAYLVCFRSPHIAQRSFGIAKYNFKTKQAVHWSEPQLFCGEPIFIANPTGDREDDGVIVSTVYDAIKQKTALLVWDAITVKELARAYLPQALPMRLHGKFVAKY